MPKKNCNKRCYATRAEAFAAIDALVRRYGSIVYRKVCRCGRCKAWHLTGATVRSPPREALSSRRQVAP